MPMHLEKGVLVEKTGCKQEITGLTRRDRGLPCVSMKAFLSVRLIPSLYTSPSRQANNPITIPIVGKMVNKKSLKHQFRLTTD